MVRSRISVDGIKFCPSVDSGSIAATIDEDAEEWIATLKFVAYGVIAIGVIVLGFIGNVLNLIILTRPNLKGVTYVYLTWLATFDLLSLVFALFSVLRLHGIQPKSYTAAFFYAHLEMPLVNSAMTSSIFIVLAVTLDRYWSVCLPSRYKDIHTERYAHLAIWLSFIVPLVLYIPVAFQKEPTLVKHPDGKEEWVPCDKPSIAQHPAYRLYLLIKEVIVRVGPVVLIAVLNTTIILTFRRLQKKRQILIGSSESRRFAEERRLVILLASIVIMFCVCMTPAAINTVLNGDSLENNFTYQVFRAFANDMEITNFATNFYVYCLCSTEIRKTFIRVFLTPISCLLSTNKFKPTRRSPPSRDIASIAMTQSGSKTVETPNA